MRLLCQNFGRWLFYQKGRNQHTESRKMKKRNMYQTKEQHKFPETDLNKTEINNLSDKKLKTKVITMLTEVRRSMYEQISIRR